MNTFRLVYWPELPGQFDHLKFRRAMTAMSAARVDRKRLSRECGLNRKEIKALLDVLNKAGAVAMQGPGRVERATSVIRESRSDACNALSSWTLRLRRWWMHEPLLPCAVCFDELA